MTYQLNFDKNWREFFYHIPDGVQVLDADYKYLYLNKTTERLSQYPPGSLIGKTMQEAYPGIEDTELFKSITEVMQTGHNQTFITEFNYPDGATATYKNTVLPFNSGVCIITSEVPEVIMKQKAALAQKNKELEQFTYMTSHDLQEPLNSIIAFSDLLEDEKEHMGDVGQKSIEVIKSSALRMKAFIVSLLDFSRIGKQSEKTVVNIQSVMDNLTTDLHDLIAKRNATVTYTGAPLTILAYEQDFIKLLQNLIVNAIKYTDTNTPPVVEIHAEAQADRYQFSVADNGIGIPEADFEKIFEVFQRLHTRKDSSGSGIGLSHCKKVVALHGGTIWLTSKVGQGSTFYFTIPKE